MKISYCFPLEIPKKRDKRRDKTATPVASLHTATVLSTCFPFAFHLIPENGRCKWCGSSSNTVSHGTLLIALTPTQTAPTSRSHATHPHGPGLVRSISAGSIQLQSLRRIYTTSGSLQSSDRYYLESKMPSPDSSSNLPEAGRERKPTPSARIEDAWCELVLHFKFLSFSLTGDQKGQRVDAIL